MKYNAEFKMALMGREIAFTMVMDTELSIDNDTIEYTKRYGTPEPEVVGFFGRAVRPGDFVIDGGACTGYLTLVLSKLVGPNGTVFAFEPAKQNWVKLSENIAVNQVTNVELFEQALWDRPQIKTLYLAADAGFNAFYNGGPNMYVVGQQEVQTMMLNDISVSPRLIKLDIEGAEEQALRGATKHLGSNGCPYIVFELNGTSLAAMCSSQKSLQTFMGQYGYEMFILHADGRLPTLIPRQTKIHSWKQNLNMLFSTIEAVGALWPEEHL